LLKQNLYFVSGTSTAFEIFEIFEGIEEIALVDLETEHVHLFFVIHRYLIIKGVS
jgi:hypothetical protein